MSSAERARLTRRAFLAGAAAAPVAVAVPSTPTLAAAVPAAAPPAPPAEMRGGVWLDSFPGLNDDDRLTGAIDYVRSPEGWAAGMPPIQLAARPHTFNLPRQVFSGLKLVGVSPGPKNLEQSPGFVPSRITLGGGISSGTSSWWNANTGNLFDVYMSNFAVQGNAGSSVHQFLDCMYPAGNLYACEFHSLAFNFMRSVFGRKDRPCAFTQVVLSGHWTANNLWDTQFTLAGSDNSLWMGGMVNIGPSNHPLQTGSLADNDYELIFSNVSKTDVGFIYMSALNGWRGVKVIGSGYTGGLNFYGGVYEGYSRSLPAPGTVIRLEGGAGAFYGPRIGQCLAAPDPAQEIGAIHMTGGDWAFYSPTYYRSPVAEHVPLVGHLGGRLAIYSVVRARGEGWAGMPRYRTNAPLAPAANPGGYSFYCPDMSMQPG